MSDQQRSSPAAAHLAASGPTHPRRRKLRGLSHAQLEDPRYYNIRWLKLLEEAETVLGAPGALFGIPGKSERDSATVRPLRQSAS